MSHFSLSAHDISFERNQQRLFANIHFTLSAGNILQIRGANGSGKSTLLRIVAGLIEPQAGNICWQGKSIHTDPDDYLSKMHYLGHQNALRPHLTLEENLQFAAALCGQRPSTAQLNTALTRVGLAQFKKRIAFDVSAGQARRLGLAKFILSKRLVWLLDEPTTALDAEGHTLLLELITEQLNQGGIVVLATHTELAFDRAPQTIELRNAHV